MSKRLIIDTDRACSDEITHGITVVDQPNVANQRTNVEE